MVKKSSLVKLLNQTNSLPFRDASACVDVLFNSLAEAISRGERIELRGFGSFFVRDVKSRKSTITSKGNNIIPAHGRVVFRPAHKLRLAAWNKINSLPGEH